MNEKVGDFLLFCAVFACSTLQCVQFMLAVLLADAHKSIWLFVSRILIVGAKNERMRMNGNSNFGR